MQTLDPVQAESQWCAQVKRNAKYYGLMEPELDSPDGNEGES